MPTDQPRNPNLSPEDIAAWRNLVRAWDARPKEVTQEKVGALMGNISQGAVSQYVIGNIRINYRAVKAFATALGIDESEIRSDLPEQRMRRGPDEPDYDDITGFSQAVGLGAESEIAEYEQTHKLKFRADSLARKRLRTPHLAVVYGKGDSMLPRIKTGDAILFDTSDTTPRDGKIFIICYPSRTGGTACSAKQCMDLDGIIYFHSLNNDGDHDWKKPRRKDDEKRPIEIMGRVRWIGSWED